MRYTVASTLALAAAVSAAPQGVTSAISPSASAPAGCSTSYSGDFQIQVVNVTSSTKHKRQAADDGTLMITLNNGVLKDNQDRTGYIAANRQFQFDGPPQTGAVYTAGWSVCSNGSLAIGDDAIFYQCLSGTFYNLYDEAEAAQCSPVYINVIGAGSGTASGAASTIGDGQVTGSAVASAISDGQIQASSAATISQISDGQIQATTSAAPVSQISDGQVQATSAVAAPVTQISDGQVQATTGAVSQISDGQIQAPTSSAVVSQIGDGQIQAPANGTVMPSGTGVVSSPTGTGSPIASYTGAASALTASGAGILALFGLMAAL